MEENVWWRNTLNGHFMKDNNWWKIAFDGRWHLMEDNLWLNTNFYGRRPFMEDDIWQPSLKVSKLFPLGDFNLFCLKQSRFKISLGLRPHQPLQIWNSPNYVQPLTDEQSIRPSMFVFDSQAIYLEVLLRSVPSHENRNNKLGLSCAKLKLSWKL